jgi:hypothetical protein
MEILQYSRLGVLETDGLASADALTGFAGGGDGRAGAAVTLRYQVFRGF